MWEPNVARLATRFDVVRYDHPGHGDAPVGPRTIEGFAQARARSGGRAGLDRFSFCGLSLGGMVGMWLAANVPERVERLVLACTAPFLPPPEQWLERAATVRAHGVEAVADAVVGRWFTERFGDPEPWRLHLVSTPAEGYARACEALAAMDLRGDLARIEAPTTVILGAHDPVVERREPALARGARTGRDARRGPPRERRAARCVQRYGARRVSHEEGMRVRREVLGDEHVDRAVARTTDFTRDFQDLITRYAWGEIWTRPGLDRRTRSAITLTALVAAGRYEELAMHVRAALRNGLTQDEIKEVLLQTRRLLRRPRGELGVRDRPARARRVGLSYAAPSTRGSSTTNVAPAPVSERTWSRPPMRRTSSREMYSPRPVPAGLRVSCGSPR